MYQQKMAQRNLGGGGGGGSNHHNEDNGDIELVSSKTLEVCSEEDKSMFYFDLLKQRSRSRGDDRSSSSCNRYLKICEKRIDTCSTRSRNRNSSSSIIVPLNGILWFVDLFTYYINCDEDHDSEDNKHRFPLPGTNGNRKKNSKRLDIGTDKAFYFDVEKNQTGRVLKITEEAAAASVNRKHVVVPAGGSGGQAQGWADFRNILEEIHEEATSTLQVNQNQILEPSDDVATQSTSSKVMRADDKRFSFHLGSNKRGHFLKISEVTRANRSSIILPLSGLIQFHQTVAHFMDITKQT